jgi:hypothetical protein
MMGHDDRDPPDLGEERMTMSNQNLGKTVGEVNEVLSAITAFLDDPITRQSGCADELLPSVNRSALLRIQTILRANGYTFFRDFLDEVEARTNSKWAYFYSGLAHLDDISGDFFWRGTSAEPSEAHYR